MKIEVIISSAKPTVLHCLGFTRYPRQKKTKKKRTFWSGKKHTIDIHTHKHTPINALHSRNEDSSRKRRFFENRREKEDLSRRFVEKKKIRREEEDSLRRTT